MDVIKQNSKTVSVIADCKTESDLKWTLHKWKLS